MNCQNDCESFQKMGLTACEGCAGTKPNTLFVYPDFIKRNEVFGEDAEEAIIQYLMKGGRNRSELENMRFEFECPTTGKMVTTKVLTIKLT